MTVSTPVQRTLGASDVLRWHQEEISTDLRAQELGREVRDRFPDLDLSHDVSWLARTEGQQSDRRIVALSARRGGELVGFAPFVAKPARLQFALGPIVFFSARVQRFVIDAGPLLDRVEPDTALAACFSGLAEHLSRDGVVFLRGVRDDTLLHRVLTDRDGVLRSSFHVVPFGASYKRCGIRWDGSVDRYLDTLGKVTRKDLRRTLKKAPSVMGVEPTLKRYGDVADVAAFVRDAVEVSKKTYQAKLGYGLTASDRSGLERAAEMGRFLGHVLFRGESPVAFHLGFMHGHRFYMVDGGYDPAWAKAQVGIYTFLRVLQDLENERVPVTLLDYLYGDHAYKVRTSNEWAQERHYYLMRRDARGTLLAAALRTSDASSRTLASLLERIGFKTRLRALLRRWTAARSAPGGGPPGRAMVVYGAVGEYAPLLATI